jgi:hypothetical protein
MKFVISISQSEFEVTRVRYWPFSEVKVALASVSFGEDLQLSSFWVILS